MIFSARSVVAPVHQGDVRGDVRQVQRLLDGRVAAADHGDRLAAVEETVAGRAGRYAAALELLFGGQAEITRRRAGGDDQGIAGIAAAVALQRERPAREVDFVDVVEHDLGVEALRVAAHALHQFRAQYAGVVAGPVVHVRGGHQLAALLDAGDQHRAEVGACGVDGGAVAGGAGAEDEHAAVLGVAHVYFDPCVFSLCYEKRRAPAKHSGAAGPAAFQEPLCVSVCRARSSPSRAGSA
jgi:hypothetical protein